MSAFALAHHVDAAERTPGVDRDDPRAGATAGGLAVRAAEDEQPFGVDPGVVGHDDLDVAEQHAHLDAVLIGQHLHGAPAEDRDGVVGRDDLHAREHGDGRHRGA